MLQFSDVTFQYPDQLNSAIRALTFECDVHGITSIVGKSGVGKSTIIALIAGVYLKQELPQTQYDGQITIDERPPESLRTPDIVSWLPQIPIFLDHLSVLDNVLLPCKLVSKAEEHRSYAIDLLVALDLANACNWNPRELSGGSKARVSLARALVTKPTYLFLDEPFISLDLANRWRICELIYELRSNTDTTTFIATHDITEAILLSHRVMVIEQRNSEQTTVQISNNVPTMSRFANPAQCFEAARNVATPIEAAMLPGSSDTD